MTSPSHESPRPGLLVLASTYPRWRNDHEPGFVHELSRRLAAEFRVTVVTSHSPGALARESMDGVDVIRYRYAPGALESLVYGGGMAANLRRAPWKAVLLPGFLVSMLLAAFRVLRNTPIEVIHAHWLLPQGLVARWVARGRGVPYVVTSHGGDLFGLRGRLATRLKRAVADASAAMTVVSTAMRDEARGLGLRPPTLDVLPMGVDLQSRFVPDAKVQRDRDRLLFVGRLVPKKGLAHLLEALPLVAARRPGVVLDIAGFGPQQAALRDQARRLGIASRVDFIGAMPQHELPALYRRASLFVAPFVRDASGDQEGLPVALMEAIGCGCPAVVGFVPGLEDLLGDATRAISVVSGDHAALADAIVSALEDPAAAMARANALREAATGKVGWSSIAGAYGRLLHRVRARAPHG